MWKVAYFSFFHLVESKKKDKFAMNLIHNTVWIKMMAKIDSLTNCSNRKSVVHAIQKIPYVRVHTHAYLYATHRPFLTEK